MEIVGCQLMITLTTTGKFVHKIMETMKSSSKH